MLDTSAVFVGAERLEKALLAAMGKANVKPQWFVTFWHSVSLFVSLVLLCREQVDLEKRMKELKLDQLIPEEACTRSCAFAVY